jgi:hypothetical protein
VVVPVEIVAIRAAAGFFQPLGVLLVPLDGLLEAGSTVGSSTGYGAAGIRLKYLVKSATTSAVFTSSTSMFNGT